MPKRFRTNQPDPIVAALSGAAWKKHKVVHSAAVLARMHRSSRKRFVTPLARRLHRRGRGRRPRSRARSRPRRRRGKSYSLGSQRSSLIPRRIGNAGLPERVNMKFRFADTGQITLLVGATDTKTMVLNDLLNPLEGSVRKPWLYDEWVSPTKYQKYRVNGVKVDLTFFQVTATGETVLPIAFVAPLYATSGDDTTYAIKSGGTAAQYLEQSRGDWKAMQFPVLNSQTPSARRSAYYSISKIFGWKNRIYVDDLIHYTGQSVSPGDKALFNFGVMSVEGTDTIKVEYRIHLTMYTTLVDVKNPAS